MKKFALLIAVFFITTVTTADLLAQYKTQDKTALSLNELRTRVDKITRDHGHGVWKITNTKRTAGRPADLEISRKDVVIQKNMIELPVNSSEEEQEAFIRRKIKPSIYKITVSFKPYSRSKFESNKNHNQNIKEKIKALQETHISDLEYDNNAQTFLATTNDQKNRFVTYWLERVELEKQLKEAAEFYIEDKSQGYEVIIDYPEFYALFPRQAVTEAKLIYDHLKLHITDNDLIR